MRYGLTLMLACAACDDPGLVGPVPGAELPCNASITIDGGADAEVFPGDPVVAAADLSLLDDGSFAAAVEHWDGTNWSVGVAFTDPMRVPLLWSLGAPPAGTTPPAAYPRLALSPSGEPALTWREPEGTLALATGSMKITLAGSAGSAGGAIAWADGQTPAVAWISPDGTQLLSSLGPIATAATWRGLDVAPAPGGGLLLAALGRNDIVFFVEPVSGGAPRMLSDRMAAILAGPRFVRGASPPEVFYIGLLARLQDEQPFLTSPGAGGQPIAVWGQDSLETLFAQGATIWTLSSDDYGAHNLDLVARGTPPAPARLTVDGPGVFVPRPEPLVMFGSGEVALAVVRDGRLEVDLFTATAVCR